MDDQRVEKAGAFVITDNRMAFVMGPTPDHSALGIVRLGGHREGTETPWQCAKREVLEESNMRLDPITPMSTFYCSNTRFDGDINLEPISDCDDATEQLRPLIIGHQNTIRSITPIFLASSKDQPVPGMETKALMLLTRTDVHRLCSQSITLHSFQLSGGKVLLAEDIDDRLPLRPFGHLRMLSIILEQYPEVIPTSMFA